MGIEEPLGEPAMNHRQPINPSTHQPISQYSYHADVSCMGNSCIILGTDWGSFSTHRILQVCMTTNYKRIRDCVFYEHRPSHYYLLFYSTSLSPSTTNRCFDEKACHDESYARSSLRDAFCMLSSPPYLLPWNAIEKTEGRGAA